MRFVVLGGGGQVARQFDRLAVTAGHEVIAVVRDDKHTKVLEALGAQVIELSLETATVGQLEDLLRQYLPDAVVLSAGAGGKGGPERTRSVDYEAAVKVFEACTAADCKRFLFVSAVDVRDRSKGVPDWYTKEDVVGSAQIWAAIAYYMVAKYDAEQVLHATKLEYTVFRPGYLTYAPAAGCQLGMTRVATCSRELLAQVMLASAGDRDTIGLTFNVMDGDHTVADELGRIANDKIDVWGG